MKFHVCKQICCRSLYFAHLLLLLFFFWVWWVSLMKFICWLCKGYASNSSCFKFFYSFLVGLSSYNFLNWNEFFCFVFLGFQIQVNWKVECVLSVTCTHISQVLHFILFWHLYLRLVPVLIKVQVLSYWWKGQPWVVSLYKWNFMGSSHWKWVLLLFLYTLNSSFFSTILKNFIT